MGSRALTPLVGLTLAAFAVLSIGVRDSQAVDLSPDDIILANWGDDAIELYDPVTDQFTQIASGPLIGSPQMLAAYRDESIFLYSFWQPFILLDATTGSQTVFADDMFDGTARGFEFDRCGNMFAAQTSPPKVLRLDAESGEASVVSEGGAFDYPYDLALAPDGDIFVADYSAEVIFRVDPVTGAQTVVASGVGGAIDVVVAGPNEIYVLDHANDRIFRVDPDAYDPGDPQANRTVVAQDGYFVTAWEFGFETSGTLVVFDGNDNAPRKLIRVDPDSYNPSNKKANQTLLKDGLSTDYSRFALVFDRDTLPDPSCSGPPDPQDYLDPTLDAPSDAPDIVALANRLQTPLEMFRYVHDEIEYEVYFGSKKGALGALWSGRANDDDQASLLIALLRAGGFKARYAIGVVEVDEDQLEQWAGVKDASDAMDRFELHYCLHVASQGLDFGPLGLCDASISPARFERRASSLLMERAWVEVALPPQYRGLDVGGSGEIWVPVDPSWKQKNYRERIPLPIGNETVVGGCTSGDLCLDYDAYYAQVDPRLASEIWEQEIQSWLADPASPVDPGKTPEDAIYDGPIVAFAGEVLPGSLAFVPVTDPPVVHTPDLGTLNDGVERRFRVRVGTCGYGDCTTGFNPYKDFDTVELVGSRLTYQFTPTARADVVREVGGYLGGEYGGANSLAEYCQGQTGDPTGTVCEVRGRLYLNGEEYVGYLDYVDRLGTVSNHPLMVYRDVIPGVFVTDVFPYAGAVYPVNAGDNLGIGLDLDAAGTLEVQRRTDGLLSLSASLNLVDEGEDDLNGNGVSGEVLIDQGTPGITPCPDYSAPDAETTCDFALAAHFSLRDQVIGELLSLAALRHSQKSQQEFRRTLALDGFASNTVPNVTVATTGFHFTYLFNQPVGVEPAAPKLDLRHIAIAPTRVDAGITMDMDRLRRELRLIAHTGSSLEHQVWEVLIGSEFVSTVKGIQLVGERFPTRSVLEVDSSNFAARRSELESFGYEPLSAATLDLMEDYVDGTAFGVPATVYTPTSAVWGQGDAVEVFIAEAVATDGVAAQMAITVGGQMLGGACQLLGLCNDFSDVELEYYGLAEALAYRYSQGGFGLVNIDSSFLTLDDGLGLTGFLAGDPVSMVSGNLHHTEEDLRLPTDGPPFHLVRTYNSQVSDAGALGVGWTHSYEMRVEPARDVREFTYLPSDMNNFDYGNEVYGVRSDTLETKSPGTSNTETISWDALPSAFAGRVEVESMTLEVAYEGNFTLDPGTGQAAVDLAAPSGEPRFESIELETAGGAPYQSLGPLTATLTNLDSSESLSFARLRIRYRGPAVERVRLEPAAGGFAGWTDGGAALQDEDPSTCAPPVGEQATVLFESQTPAGLFGYELKVAVQRVQDGSAGSPESIVFRGTDAGEMFRTGPNHSNGARQHFMTTDLDAHGFLVTFDQDGKDEDPERQHQLCHLDYRALTLPEQREFVRGDGARDRFTWSGTEWIPAPGVRSRLEDLAAPAVGYRVTEPNGRVLTFEQAGANGAYHLTQIADPQGRALDLTYDGSNQLEQVIWANSPQPPGSKEALTFSYDGNGKLDSVEDWSLRKWDYTVDAAEDLREVRDPIESENGWTGTLYDYLTGETNEDLNHNLQRVTFPKDADATPGGDHWVEFEYYNSDQVAAHVDSLGNRQTFTFNIPRQETSTTDARGFTTLYRHDHRGNLVQRVDPDGAIWSWTYDETRNVTSETDPFGRTRTFTGHDARGNPAQIVDRDGKSTSFTYDDVSGAPKTITDKRGHVRTVQFSSDGLPEEIRATLGGATPLLVENLYDPISRRLDRTLEPLGDGTGRQALTIYTYVPNSGNRDIESIAYWEDDGNGTEGEPGDRLLSTVDFQYDALGRRTHETVYRTKAPDDASLVEITTETVYTKRDEIERVIRPDGTALVSQYDRNGNLELQYLEETLAGGSTVEHQRRELRYDALDRLIEVEDARNGITRFAYDAVGNRIAATDPEGHTTRVEYDAMNRPVRVIDPNGAVTTTEYDAAGRVVAVTDATGVVTRRGYDEVGRLVSLQQGENQAATREVFYDTPSPGDYFEELTDPNGNLTSFEFDELGRVFRTTDATPQAGLTQLDYDLRSNLIRFADPEGAETHFRFDALGRNEEVQRSYATGPHATAYDELGNPIRVTKPDGCVLEQTYDAMSRLVRQRSTAACPAEVAAVDDRYGYDARGNLIAAQNAHVGLIREYDSLDRLVREIDDRFGTAVGALYDDASRLTSKLYPNGSLVQISYDGAGRPIGITDRFGDTTRYVYDPAGRRLQTRGTKTGITTNLSYDANGRLASIESLRADQTVASHFAYPAYDDAGNRTQMEVLAGAGQTLGTTDYVYDALHRLIEETRPGESTTHFEYDQAGNRTRSGKKSGSTWVAPYLDYAYENAGPVTHRLTAITDDAGTPLHTFSAYDANGNPTEWDDGGGLRTLRWDALDRLVSISGAFEASYAYDPFGRRIEKTESGATTQYQYDGLDVVAEYDGTGALLATYLFGPGIDEPLKVERGATVAAYHTDGLGSVVALSDAEAPGGSDLATYEYDAFGNLESSTGPLPNAYTYTGRELDASGLYYYRARYYLPPAGRFLTPDPIGLRGGANPYVYVGSNPVNFRDPFGLEAFGGFLDVAAPSSTQVADFGGLSSGAAPGFREFLFDVQGGLRGGGIGGGLIAASEFFEDRADFFRISADEALAQGDANLWDTYAAQSRRNRFAAMMLRPTSVASLLAGGFGPGMLRSGVTRPLPNEALVVGEGMRRILAFADELTSLGVRPRIYSAPNMNRIGVPNAYGSRKSLDANWHWIDYWARKRGVRAFDIGPQPGRTTPSPYYQMESRNLRRWEQAGEIEPVLRIDPGY